MLTQSTSTPPGFAATGTNGQTLNYGMDTDIVNSSVWGPQMLASLQSIPSISIVTDSANLWNSTTGIYVNATQDGDDWERPASVELINPDGTTGFQINAGLRIRGGYSRNDFNPKHAFRLFFNDDYDGEARTTRCSATKESMSSKRWISARRRTIPGAPREIRG